VVVVDVVSQIQRILSMIRRGHGYFLLLSHGSSEAMAARIDQGCDWDFFVQGKEAFRPVIDDQGQQSPFALLPTP
jgi:hypothetical protein